VARRQGDTAVASATPAQTALSDATLPEYVRGLGLAGASDEIRVEPAGDGNINWVRRVRVGGERSVVVKQARAALERFPQYRASTERIVFERRWLEIARPLDRGRVCPEVLAFDETGRVLVLEDLGGAERLDHAMSRGPSRAVADAAASLATLLGAVHGATAARAAELAPRFANDDMRRLHGEHVFALPFRRNDFALPEGLQLEAERIWGDGDLVAIADHAYARYLQPRGALVHGDVQAGNVLLAARGPVLLDAEIAHVGDPAFDVGTLIAHLLLPAVARGAAAGATAAIAAAWEGYAAAHREHAAGAPCPVFADVSRYAAIEMLRRTIGAARVAAVAEAAASRAVLAGAVRLMRRPAMDVAALAAACSAQGAGRKDTR
jgi:5-methylthioribose kinase